MCNIFDNIPLDNEENISEERVENIKTSVLSRIKKEEQSMKKSTVIKTLSIAGIAAATALMSVMAAGAETNWTPTAEVENTVDNAAETEVPEVTEDNTIDNEKPGEAAFKEYIEKAKAEDDGTPKGTPEIVNGWICGSGEASYKEYKEKGIAENGDYITVFYNDERDVYYYYDNDNPEVVPHEAIYKEVDGVRIVNNEVKELLYEDGKLVYVKLEV